MHRNTYLVVSALAVLAALVVGVNLGKKLSPAPAAPQVTPTPASTRDESTRGGPTPAGQTFVNTACGFSLTYPDSLTLMDSASGSAFLRSATDQSQSIVMTCQKNIPVPTIAAENIESLSLSTTNGSSISAKLYHNQSLKDGSPADVLLFAHPTKKTDVFIAGYGEAFNNLIKTIQVIP